MTIYYDMHPTCHCILLLFFEPNTAYEAVLNYHYTHT